MSTRESCGWIKENHTNKFAPERGTHYPAKVRAKQGLRKSCQFRIALALIDPKKLGELLKS